LPTALIVLLDMALSLASEILELTSSCFEGVTDGHIHVLVSAGCSGIAADIDFWQGTEQQGTDNRPIHALFLMRASMASECPMSSNVI
jgi:hypothetical protein